MKKQQIAAGFTLIETLVAVALTSVVIVALGVLIQYFYKTNGYALEQVQAVNSARQSIENAMRDLREASYGADGAYPISSAATSSITFYANIDTDLPVERVRYFLSGTTLYRGATDPAGSPPSYASQPETMTLVVDNIRNTDATPLFTYYDASGAVLTAPINVAEIASIRIEVLTDVNPERAPNVYTMDGAATLRNLHATN